MYGKLNITENHLRTLTLFTRGFKKSLYIREVNRELNISPRTAQLILESIEKKGILKSELKGKIRIYELKNNWKTRQYLLLTEQYKLLTFTKKHQIIKEIIEKIEPTIKGTGLIFGSYAKGQETKESDLDILIIGKHDQEKTEEISKQFNIDISIKEYTTKKFTEKYAKDYLIREALDNHVVIKGTEDLLKVVL